jgi:hypothetical protein
MTSSSHDSHASDAMVGPHGAGDHGEDHGHDDHAHGDGETLGRVNFAAWGAGLIGILAGLAVAGCLMIAAGWLG